MCSESETSPPRLSFSHDFICEETEPVEAGGGSCYLGLNSDFEFSFISENEEQSSSADDLFCNGVIVPIGHRNKIQISQQQPSKKKTPFSLPLPPLPHSFAENPTAMADSSELEQKQRSKSFWGFKRSSSLHCESERSRTCSNSLLLRSNSTGSNPNQKRTTSKEVIKKHSEKQTATEKSSSSSPPLFYTSSSKSFSQRKIHRGFYGSYPWISPVLNVPPPYISRGTTNLFGFGCCLRHGKEKQSKK